MTNWVFFVVVVLANGQITTQSVTEFKSAQDCVDYLRTQDSKHPRGLENLNGRIILRGCQALEAVQ